MAPASGSAPGSSGMPLFPLSGIPTVKGSLLLGVGRVIWALSAGQRHTRALRSGNKAVNVAKQQVEQNQRWQQC